MSRLFHLNLVVVAAFTPALVLANPAPKTPPKDPSNGFYPTAVGTKWAYQDERYGDYTEEITAVEVKDGSWVLTVRRTTEKDKDNPKAKPWDRKVAVTDNGVFSGDGPKKTCLLTLPPKPGDTWRGIWDPSWTCTVTGTEKVKVPAGEYDAVRIDAHSGEHLTAPRTIDWYAPGVGLVLMKNNTGGGLKLKSFTRGKGKE